MGNLKEYCFDTFVSSCCKKKRGRCRKTQKARLIETARQRLEQEVNIIDIIKSRRYFHMALRHLLPQSKQEELLEKSRFVHIFPSNSDEGKSDDTIAKKDQTRVELDQKSNFPVTVSDM